MKKMGKYAAWALACWMAFSAALPSPFAEEPEAEPTPAEEQIVETAEASDPAEDAGAIPAEEANEAPAAEPTQAPAADPTEAPAPTEASTPDPAEAPAETPAAEPTQTPAADPTEAPVPEVAETPAPTEAPVETPAVEPTQTTEAGPTEAPASEPTETPAPTEAPVETPAAEPTQAPEADPTEVPTPESTEMPTSAPTEAPAAPFEQREQIGDAAVTVTAPAGVMAPGSRWAIEETSIEEFIQSVLAASQAQGDLIRHRMIRFSGAEMNGAALITISDPLIAELAGQYPEADVRIYVYAYQPEALRVEDHAKRIGADVEGNAVSFYMTEPAVIDVMIVVTLPAPAEEAVPESANDPDPQADPEETAQAAEEPEDAVLPESLEEAPIGPADEPDIETLIEPAEELEIDAIAEPADESAEEDGAEPTEAPSDAAAMEDAEEAEEKTFTVTVSASFEGELGFGAAVVLTATLSIDDPQAVIDWQYSPDGGETVCTVEGEHGRTLTYTYTEENQDYIWRVAVYPAQ